MEFDICRERASRYLFISCAMVYMVICLIKINYVASIAYIVNEGIFSKADSGMISAAFYLLYGIGQILGGSIVDRFSPYKVISFGVTASIITNILLIFTNNFWHVLFLWGITGLVQFGIWPATARIITGFLVPGQRQNAGVYITFALAAGGIISYFVVTPALNLFGWSGVFTMNVIVLLAVLLLWKLAEVKTAKILMPSYQTAKGFKADKKTDVPFIKLFFSSGLFIIIFLSVAQSMLDNGVKTWVPTMMMESYNISPAWASMQTAVLYICNILGVLLLVHIFRKIKNPVLVQTIYFLICLPACILMLFAGEIPLWLTLGLLIVSTTVTYAMTSISVRIAAAFEKYGYSGTVSGVINAFACFGIVIGNGGYGFIAEKAGWGAVTAVWLLVCALAIIAGFTALLLWNRFHKA